MLPPSAAVPRDGDRADLVGANGQRQLVQHLVADTRNGGWCRVLVGEAGIGRTTLLAAGRRAAADHGFRVLNVFGSHEERLLPYAGVHQLLLAMLAEPERSAPAIHPYSEPYAVAVEVVERVLNASKTGPIVVVVDDLHWIDDESAQVIAFLSRRLGSHPVGLLAAWRASHPDDVPRWQLPTVRVDRLDVEASAVLVDRLAPNLSPQQRCRVLRQGRGNPLALNEFAAVAASGSGLPLGPLPDPIQPTRALVDAFSPTLAELPSRTRLALLVAAVDDALGMDDVVTMVGRLDSSDPDPTVLQPATDRNLIEMSGGRVCFTHPVLHSLVFHSVDDSERARLHRGIAGLAKDPDRRVWHGAAAADRPDPEVALELDSVADAARNRGDQATAWAALLRGAALSHNDAARVPRLVAAGEIGCDLGDLELVDHALGALDRLPPGSADQLRVDVLHLQANLIRNAGSVSVPDLVATVRRGGDGGPAAPRIQLLLAAATQCWREGVAADSGDILAAAEQICPDPTDAHRLVILAMTAPLAQGPLVLDRLADLVGTDRTPPDRAALLAQAAYLAGDPSLARTLLATATAGLRRSGRLAPLARALGQDAHAAVELGRWVEALASAQECIDLAERTHQPAILALGEAVRGIVAAVRGDEMQALELLGRSERTALEHGTSGLVALVQLGRGIAAISTARFDEAWTQLRQIWDRGDEMSRRVLLGGIGYVAEAARHCGDDPAAAAVLADIQGVATASSAPGFRVGAAYAQAIAGSDYSADQQFDQALASCPPQAAFDRARIQLARGVWLRRERRVAESRLPLRDALVTFERLGTAAWAEQARSELRASGERSARRDVGPVETLSAQELQIVRLAAAGVTNREIGQRLCLSHRTIGSHLYRAFPKLGISSRAELRDLLPSLGETPQPLAS